MNSLKNTKNSKKHIKSHHIAKGTEMDSKMLKSDSFCQIFWNKNQKQKYQVFKTKKKLKSKFERKKSPKKFSTKKVFEPERIDNKKVEILLLNWSNHNYLKKMFFRFSDLKICFHQKLFGMLLQNKQTNIMYAFWC